MRITPESLETAIKLGEEFMVDALKRRPANVQSMGDMKRATGQVEEDIRTCANATALFIDWGGSFMEADGLPRPTYEDYLQLRRTEG
jgi:hypothetical protein